MDKLARRKESLYRCSRNIFRKFYKQDMSAEYVLLARERFEDAIESGAMTLEAGFALLNTPEVMSDFVERIQKEEEQRKAEALEKKVAALQAGMGVLQENTNPSLALKMAVGVNALFLMAATLFNPFTTAWLQPTADRLFGRDTVTPQAPHMVEYVPFPVPVPTAPSVTNTTMIFECAKEEIKVKRPVKRRGMKRAASARKANL